VELNYNSGHSAWIENAPFAYDLVKIVQPTKIVELGVHYGDSYFTFCQSAKDSKVITEAYGVDLWEGDDLTGYYGKEVYEQVNKYNNDNFGSFSTLVTRDFTEFSTEVLNHSVDLLHIDGSHYYDDVKHDFNTWILKMSSSGIILMHDTKVMKERYGVWKFWKEIQSNFQNVYEFDNKYGLGVILLGKKYPNSFMELLKCQGVIKK
jgi:O-antigen biosynthesis protein